MAASSTACHILADKRCFLSAYVFFVRGSIYPSRGNPHPHPPFHLEISRHSNPPKNPFHSVVGADPVAAEWWSQELALQICCIDLHRADRTISKKLEYEKWRISLCQ
jgi:hypothetical protein